MYLPSYLYIIVLKTVLWGAGYLYPAAFDGTILLGFCNYFETIEGRLLIALLCTIDGTILLGFCCNYFETIDGIHSRLLHPLRIFVFAGRVRHEGGHWVSQGRTSLFEDAGTFGRCRIIVAIHGQSLEFFFQNVDTHSSFSFSNAT